MIAKIGERAFSLVLSPLPGNRLPKKAPLVPVILNGSPFSAPVTSNKGWAKPDAILEYLWVTLDDGKSYYLTLEPMEKAASLASAEIATADGAGPKPPARVSKLDANGKPADLERVAKFRATWEARNPVTK